MKLLKKLTVLISCSLLLTACPYEANEPLSSDVITNIESYNLLPGRWVYSTNEDSLVLNVEESTAGLRIIMTDSEGEKTQFEGTVSQIKGIDFINLKNIEKANSKFYFIKYEVKSNKLKAYYAADKYITNYKSKDESLKDFFANNCNKKGFWTNKMTFIKSDN